jgi:hypothetical protein
VYILYAVKVNSYAGGDEKKYFAVKVTFNMIFICTNETGIGLSGYGCSLMRTSTKFCIESLPKLKCNAVFDII